MNVNIVVPELGESISEATVANWLKSPGDAVEEGEILLELETDKVMVEVPATTAGILSKVEKEDEALVHVGEVLGQITSGEAEAESPHAASKKEESQSEQSSPAAEEKVQSPAVRRLAQEHNLNLEEIAPSGKGGKLVKSDVLQAMEKPSTPAPAAPAAPVARQPQPINQGPTRKDERRVPMSRLRQKIAERLLEAQENAAILTTFNEVDMSAAMAFRKRYNDMLKESYGVGVGFMSLFTKAAVVALKAFPAVNAEIQGSEILYKEHYDIGVAVGTERGLVVPVLREADGMGLLDIEKAIADLAVRARGGKISLEELSGGTFTISNGGIYGSMLSTPILNPPQSGILGLHNIVQRPVVDANKQIVAKPIMYVALSYDHRIIDGREAVQFLVKVKQCVENPDRLLLGV